MKQLTVRANAVRVRNAPVEPLAEGNLRIVKRRKHRSWKSMNDYGLVAYANEIISKKEIKNRKGLENADRRLYEILRRRRLLDFISLEKPRQEGQRSWKSMTDDELVAYAKQVIAEKGITNRKGLENNDRRLYQVLSKRKLLDAVLPEKQGYRDWQSKSDDEVVAYAYRVIEENQITHREGLRKTDASLYQLLRKRGLLNRIPLKHRNQRSWRLMSNEEIIAHTSKLISEKGIKNRKDLHQVDNGLYRAMVGRNLMGRVFANNGDGIVRHADTPKKRFSNIEKFLASRETGNNVVE